MLSDTTGVGAPVNWVLQRVRLFVFCTAHYLDYIVPMQHSEMVDADMNIDHPHERGLAFIHVPMLGETCHVLAGTRQGTYARLVAHWAPL